MLTLTVSPLLSTTNCGTQKRLSVSSESNFPMFLPKEMENIKDPFARKLATRIERLPVNAGFAERSIMSSCVKPLIQRDTSPVVLLHGFDRYTFPLLEEAGFETWALDILGWGFSDLERLPSCDVASKRDHLYQNQLYTLLKVRLKRKTLRFLPCKSTAARPLVNYQNFWKSYIRKPIILVGPSLGAAVAIDFAVNHPETVEKLVLIDASVYAEGTGNLAKLPRAIAYAGVYLLKSIPLRLYVNLVAFNGLPLSTSIDWMNVGRLHCLYPWWEDATVSFMISGGYNVSCQIEKVKQRTLIIWGEDDQIISYKMGVRLHCELPNAVIRQIPECGHIPHVERPKSVSKLIIDFVGEDSDKEALCVSQV